MKLIGLLLTILALGAVFYFGFARKTPSASPTASVGTGGDSTRMERTASGAARVWMGGGVGGIRG